MNLWRDITNLKIGKVLRMGRGAVIKVVNSDNTESTVDLTELAALDGIAATDLAKIDGITNGTAAAGKAVVLDASGNIDTIGVGAITGADASLGVTGLASTQGGAIAVTGGTSSTSANAGGAIALVGGTPGATGIGGAATVTGGIGGSTSGAGGAVSLTGGAATAGNTAGGAAAVTGGASTGSGTGGVASLTGGAAGAATGTGGSVSVAGGVGNTTGAGGAITLAGGAGGNDAVGGAASVTGGAAGGGNRAGGASSLTGGAGAGTGSGGAASVTGGASGAGATGNGGTASLVGGAAASTDGNGGNVILTPGALAGTGVAGMVVANGVIVSDQGAPNAQTTAATLTIANLLTGIITGTHAVGGTQAYTLPTGTLTDAGVQMAADEAFDWVLINLSAAAADTITVTAGVDHTLVGEGIVQSAHATTGQLYGNSARFRTRKTAANTFVTYRIA